MILIEYQINNKIWKKKMKNFSEKNSPSFVNKPVKNIKVISSISNTNLKIYKKIKILVNE